MSKEQINKNKKGNNNTICKIQRECMNNKQYFSETAIKKRVKTIKNRTYNYLHP